MGGISVDLANRHAKKIQGLIAVSEDLVKSEVAGNVFRCSVAEKFTEKTKISDNGNIITSYGMDGTFFKKAKYIGVMLFFPVIVAFLFVYSVFFCPRKFVGKNYKCGVRVYDGDYGFKSGRDIDFIIGGGVRKDDVLFCAETDIPENYRNEFIRRNYNFILLKHCFCLGDIARVVTHWPRFLFHSFGADAEDVRVALDIMYKYILWTGFINCVDVDVYLVYGDYVPTSLIRTALLNRSGGKVWYYANSYAYWYVYTGGEDKINPFLAFYSCDKAITWGSAQMRFIKNQSEHILSVENTGCLWAQEVKETDGAHDGIIISVFDTSYAGTYSPVIFSEITSFIGDIIRLAEERPDITFLYKTKVHGITDTETNPEVRKLYDRMKATPNIKIVTDGIKAMAVSDLIIAIPFTSPAMEAWAAGMKAIYHNVGKTRSNLCDRIPNVVSYNYDELKVLVDYWLNDVNGIILNMFSQQYILGEIDAYMDCKGIDRLRKMILNEESARS